MSIAPEEVCFFLTTFALGVGYFMCLVFSPPYGIGHQKKQGIKISIIFLPVDPFLNFDLSLSF